MKIVHSSDSTFDEEHVHEDFAVIDIVQEDIRFPKKYIVCILRH